MKNLIKVTLLVVGVLCFSCKAQKSFSGKIDGYSDGKADILSFGGSPILVGKVDESGRFNIPLQTDFIEQTQKAMEEFNNGPSSGKFRMNTLEKAFSCFSGDSLKITNGDQVASSLASFGCYEIADFVNKRKIGFFMATNSMEFAEAFGRMGQVDAVKGYYLNWYFVNEPAKIEGTCRTKTYALNQKDFYDEVTTYQYNFKKGWNLVKISADDIYTDSDGKKYFAAWTYKTISSIPEDVQYLFLQG